MVRRARDNSAGFTLVELLVCLGVVGILLALILPAVNNARAASRRTQCTNNLRQLAVAIMQFHDVRGHFPNSGTFAINGDDCDCDGRPDNPGGIPSPNSTFWMQWAGWSSASFQDLRPLHGWTIDALPFLEQSRIVESWDHRRPFYDQKCTKNLELADTPVAVFACPADDSLARGHGNLSYVVNGGFGRGWNLPIDWNGNGITKDFLGIGPLHEDTRDQEQSKRLGLMFLGNNNQLSAFDFRHAARSVRDGLSSTILLTENVRTGYDDSSTPGIIHTWATPSANHVAFYVTAQVCAMGCKEDVPPHWSLANHSSTGTQINSPISKAEGMAPRPSSMHAGGVNMAFCDGSVRFLAESVDGTVFAKLVSPNGGSLPYSSHRHLPLGDDEY